MPGSAPHEDQPTAGTIHPEVAADSCIPGEGAEREPGAGPDAAGEPAGASPRADPQAAGSCRGLVGSARRSRPLGAALPGPVPAPMAAALGPGPGKPAAAVQVKRRLQPESRASHLLLHLTSLNMEKASPGCVAHCLYPHLPSPSTGCSVFSPRPYPCPFIPPKPREWGALDPTPGPPETFITFTLGKVIEHLL